jgi:hypothetical protein|tara:strand:- start:357 stop:632 length:276 start_codon:yes stop_codon:yes gene_type:complete
MEILPKRIYNLLKQLKMTKHPQEGTDIYRIFVNGALLNTTSVYDFAMNRALGIAMFLKLEFINTGANEIIMDKWKGKNGMIIITKNKISEL